MSALSQALAQTRTSTVFARKAIRPLASVSRSVRTTCACNSVRLSQRQYTPSVFGCAARLKLPTVTQARRGRSMVQRVDCMQKVSDLPPSLAKIVTSFQIVPDPMARYKQLLFYATKLDPLPPEDHIPENKVQGCVSQVWVKPQLRDDGKVYFQADSDSQLTKGLAALLVNGLSGCTPKEILTIEPTFIELLGLKQSLTPSRNNGFLNMFLLMKKKTLELAMAQVASQNGGS